MKEESAGNFKTRRAGMTFESHDRIRASVGSASADISEQE
jgi:hypothetical protein